MKKIKISHPEKVLFPKDKITKLDVIKYYYDVSSLMMPYIKNRILSVVKCHESIDKECFIKRHPANDKEKVHIFNYNGEEYFFLKKMEQLIYQVQNGTLEFHIGGSTINKIDKPNIMVFDLDPDEKIKTTKLQNATLKVKSVLDELKLESFLKTSGGKGYHIVVPFKDSTNWDTFYEFSKKIALILENKWPKIFTTSIKKSERNNKVFVDYLRNNKSSTCVAPFSIRAKNKAPISFPISWKDLMKIKPDDINIKNYKKYINNSWDNFFNVKQKLK